MMHFFVTLCVYIYLFSDISIDVLMKWLDNNKLVIIIFEVRLCVLMPHFVSLFLITTLIESGFLMNDHCFSESVHVDAISFECFVK